MKKYLSICMSAMLGMFAASCSSDDELVPDEQNLNGNESFICVSIHATDNAGTRAGENFAYGTANEQKINEAYFYFFDSNNNLLAKSEVSGTELGGSATAESGSNVEFNAKAVLSVTLSTMPNKVVTVINPPTNFVAKSPLSTLWGQTLDTWRGDVTKTDDFTMSTSSYLGNNGTLYYYTSITNPEKAFKATKAEAKAALEAGEALDIYVERLACKVTVNLADALKAKGTTNNDKFTVKIGTEKVYGMNNNEAQDIYVTLDNWAINATTQSTYVLKNSETEVWKEDGKFTFEYNAPSYYRSYWAKSTNYGLAYTYPQYYEENKDYLLKYVSETEMDTKALKFDGTTADYCNENTNTVDLVTPNTSAVSNALINARLTKSDGTEFGDIIKYLGNYYTYDYYEEFVLSALADTLKNVKYDGNAITAKEVTISNAKDIELEGGSYKLNGRIAVQLDPTTVDDSKLTIDGKNDANTKAAINGMLASFNKVRKAIAYKEGRMYYSVPIRHLGTDSTKEGYYGVVRNHWYSLTIDDITKPGHGIEDPDEPIIPNADDDKEYYLAASINILSWRVLTQNVNL